MKRKQSPDIFRYHDYRAFLKDWVAAEKAASPGFSLRTLAKRAQVASGYLPMVLAGTRPLTSKVLAKLAPHLSLGKSERAYLELLVTLGSSDSQEARLDALERMKGFRSYRRSNPKETEVYQYLTRWYYVAIREMAALPGFRAAPEWIQERLKAHVPLGEIKQALEFLVSNGYIQLDAEGNASLPEKGLDCVGGVYRVALTQFHQEMFSLAARSIVDTPAEERSIVGHTVALRPEEVEEAKRIIAEALERIRRLGEGTKDPDIVYHAELSFFPLTRRG